jgi:hypothetical protein
MRGGGWSRGGRRGWSWSVRSRIFNENEVSSTICNDQHPFLVDDKNFTLAIFRITNRIVEYDYVVNDDHLSTFWACLTAPISMTVPIAIPVGI